MEEQVGAPAVHGQVTKFVDYQKIKSAEEVQLFAEGVRRIRMAGGIASLAHPVRVKSDLPAILPELCKAGLNAIEAYHSDHSSAETGLYLELARKYGLLVTGGSDFHGDAKPGVRLGSGCEGNLKIPDGLVRRLRAAVNVQART